MPDNGVTGLVERELFLRSMNMLRPLGNATVELARAMRDMHFSAGSKLFREGDASHHIYYIMHGSVRMFRGEDSKTFGDRSAVGIIDAIQDRAHAWNAEAITDVHALVIKSDDYLEVLEDNFAYARGAVSTISNFSHLMSVTIAETGGFDPPSPSPCDTTSAELNVIERTIMLRNVAPLRRGGIQPLTRLAGLTEARRLEAGEVLFHRGEPSRDLWVVAAGTIEIERESPRIRARFGPGSLVMDTIAFADIDRPYTARAIEPTTALLLRREDFFDVLEDHFELVRAVLSACVAGREKLAVLTARAESAPSEPAPSTRPQRLVQTV
jgi:CRP-like cAMP-binding protein